MMGLVQVLPRVTEATYINRTAVLRQKDSAQIATVRRSIIKND
jgi:hypothetical protein